MKPDTIKIKVRILRDTSNASAFSDNAWTIILKCLAKIWDSEQYV